MIVWVSAVAGAAILTLVLLHPTMVEREVAAVEAVAPVAPYQPPRTLDVRVLSGQKLKRFNIQSGDCRTQKEEGARGPFEVKSVLLSGNRIWICPDPKQKRPNPEQCLWGQKLDLECLEPPMVSAQGVSPRRLGRTLTLRIFKKTIRIVTRVDLEQYVEDVVMTEHPTAPFETRRVQAIVARTFAMHAMEDPRHDDAPVCDSQHCQAYSTAVDPTKREPAAITTKSVVLVDSQSKLAPTFFSSTCGGRTRDAQEVWPGAPIRDIVAIRDADLEGHDYCAGSPHHDWKLLVPDEQVAKALSDEFGRKLDARTLRFDRADPEGLQFAVKDKNGKRVMRASAIYRELGRAFGFTRLKSADFVTRRKGRAFNFIGHGLGHGVGLCQYGAEARAKAGQSAEEILRAYFPKLELAHLDDVRPQH